MATGITIASLARTASWRKTSSGSVRYLPRLKAACRPPRGEGLTVEGPSGRFGKWSQPGVPHRGWSCVDIEDLGAPDLVCEMCERQEIRSVHHMEHPDYPGSLRCGCICAGHMEEDLTGAQRR